MGIGDGPIAYDQVDVTRIIRTFPFFDLVSFMQELPKNADEERLRGYVGLVMGTLTLDSRNTLESRLGWNGKQKTTREIAEETGRSTKAVSRQYSNGLKRVEDVLTGRKKPYRSLLPKPPKKQKKKKPKIAKPKLGKLRSHGYALELTEILDGVEPFDEEEERKMLAEGACALDTDQWKYSSEVLRFITDCEDMKGLPELSDGLVKKLADEGNANQGTWRQRAWHPLLPSNLAFALGYRKDKGCVNSRNVLVLYNRRWAWTMATKYVGVGRSKGFAAEDIEQEAMFGLERAADTYKPELGFAFSTHASFHIKGKIIRALEAYGGMIHIPVKHARTEGNVYKVMRKFNCDLDEACDFMGIKRESFEALHLATRRQRSLDAPRFENDDWYSVVWDNNTNTEIEAMRRAFSGDIQRTLASSLTEREQYVINMRFGMGYRREHTLQEIGDNMGCTRENVRLIEAKALKKLRVAMRDLDHSYNGGTSIGDII
ncbi:MAG: sigma-70 family RNA polymerase sigma factor [Candidatus Nanoarchaeia archaeon]